MATKKSKTVRPPNGDGDNGAEHERDSTSSLVKTLGILDLFTSAKPRWSTQEILGAVQASRSTGYRYIRALTAAGLLSPVGNGYYMLGPRIIELDLQIRTSDPLLQAADGILEQLVEVTDHSAILCMLFQSSVLCIKECRAQMSPRTLFSRGQRRSLFKGAMSKIILAHLPNHRLRSIFSRRGEDVADANLGADWAEFRNALGRIRSDGYVKSVGEFYPGIVGLAAPIFNGEGAIIGSLGIAWDERETVDDFSRLVRSLKRAGREISQRMATSGAELALPPRAVG